MLLVTGLPESGHALVYRALSRVFEFPSERGASTSVISPPVVHRSLGEKYEEDEVLGDSLAKRILVIRDPIAWSLSVLAAKGASPARRLEQWFAAHEGYMQAAASRCGDAAMLQIERFVDSPVDEMDRCLKSLNLSKADLLSAVGMISSSDRRRYLKSFRDSTPGRELAEKFVSQRVRFVRLGYDPFGVSSDCSGQVNIDSDRDDRDAGIGVKGPSSRHVVKPLKSPEAAKPSRRSSEASAGDASEKSRCDRLCNSVSEPRTQPTVIVDANEAVACPSVPESDRRVADSRPAVIDARESFTPGSRPLRVGFVTPSLCLGGAERWMVSLASNSDPKKIEWVGTALSPWGSSDSTITAEMRNLMPIYTSTARNRPACVDPAIALLSTAQELMDTVAGRADVLISWGTPQANGTAKRYACRSVFVSHCSFPTTGTIHSASLEGIHLVAVSSAARAPFSELLKSRTTVIHNGVDEERCRVTIPRDEMRKSWGFEDHHRLVGYVGRTSQEKNPLAAAWAVKELGGDFRAVYVGAGRQQDEVCRAAKEIAGDCVTFIPPLEPIGNALGALDAFVLASPSEGFSLALGEAWLAGLPTVATRVGAVPELEERYGPLVVPVPIDPSAENLAEAVLLATSEANRETVERAREVVKAEYTSKRMAERWCDYLYGLMSEESAR